MVVGFLAVVLVSVSADFSAALLLAAVFDFATGFAAGEMVDVERDVVLVVFAPPAVFGAFDEGVFFAVGFAAVDPVAVRFFVSAGVGDFTLAVAARVTVAAEAFVR